MKQLIFTIFSLACSYLRRGNNTNKRLTALLSLLLLMSGYVGWGQTTIYNADFSNNGDGFADHTTSNPPASGPASVGPFGSVGNQWSLSYSSTPGTDSSSNSFSVSGGALISDDWGGQGIFESQSIDLTNINTISISAISTNTGANDNNFRYFYVLDGGSRVETANISSSNGNAVNYSIVDLDVSGNSSIVVGFEFSENGSGDGYTTNSFIVTTPASSSTPTITVSPTTLSGFSYTVGNGPSAEQTFTVEGSNLTADITVTPPTNYEISTGTGGSFSATNPITLSPTNGSVSSTTIYARLKSGLQIGNFNGEAISITTDGATAQTVVCSGSITRPDNPSSFLASTSSASQIDLSWALNSNSNNVIVVFDTDGSFTDPVDGTAYSGSALGGTVIYNSNGTIFNHTGLDDNTTYYYKAWSVDGSNNYSAGVIDNATTLKVEPTAYVTGFDAIEDGTDTVIISWTDATGETLPDGYIVKANTTGTFADPIDGTDPTEDVDLSNGSALIKVDHGTEIYEFTGLSANTQYFFKIWSYTNSGTNINFKIDGAVPTADATTDEYCTPAPSSTDGNGITRVVMGSIDNTSGSSAIAYGDYSDLSTDVVQAANVNLYITFETGFTYNTKIWVDWNNDKDFEDEGEEVYSGESLSNNPTTLSVSFSVPADASLGSRRLRIGGADTETPTPCYTGTYAAFEDYTINVVAPYPEPTNHVSSFTATTEGTAQIDLTWDANNGDQAAGSFLIKASTTSLEAIADPSDTNAEVDDTDLSDGSGVVNVVNGGTANESYSWSGLTEGTTYYFKIYPYTNSGSNIDYKTDGSVPSATETTFGPPTATAATSITPTSFTANWDAVEGATSYRLDVSEYEDFEIAGENATDLFISEYVEGSGNNKYIEIYNGTGSDVTLTGTYELRLYNNGSTSVSNTEALTGTLPNNATLVFKNSQATIYGGSATSADVCNFNGNDAVSLAKNGTNIDVVGTIGSSSTFGEDVTLTRKSSIDSPNSTYTSAEWNSSSQNDVSDLGSHTFSGGSTPSFVTGYEDRTVNGTSQSVTGLTATTTYYYRVRAYDGTETTGNSNTITVTTPTPGLWTGATSSAWATASNWDDGTVPTSVVDVIIPDGTSNNPTVSTLDAACNNLTVNSGATLTVASTGGLTVAGNFTNNGSVTLNSNSQEYSSLIVVGTATGNIQYNRYVNEISTSNSGNNGNDLIASPVDGQNVQEFVTANANLSQNGSNTEVAFALFNNNSGNYENYAPTDTDLIETGKGYRAATDNGSAVTFSGTVLTASKNVTITQGTVRNWNLIGNPYSSYIDAAAFLTANSSNLRPSYVAIYGYDADDSGTGVWSILDLNSSPSALISPGQGFFVASPSSGSTAVFTPNMRTTGTDDDFIAGRNTTSDTNFAHAILNLNTASASYGTNVYFRDINTLGLDPGYDTGAFDQTANGIYSHLVADNTGVALANQSLPFTSLSDQSIPLVVNANAGEQLTFGLNTNSNIPDNINVYLEDQLAGSVTLLNTNSYTLTPMGNLSGPGRFYLRFTDNALNVNQQDLSTINLYTVDKELIIAGFLQHRTTATIFDIQGRAILSVPLDVFSQLQKIDMRPFTTGIYIVQLTNNITALSQKIILK